MKSYTPGPITDPTLRRECLSIVEAAQRAEDFLLLRVLYAAPAKTQAGMVIYADGSTFNPGSGEGVYVRNLANSAWRYLG